MQRKEMARIQKQQQGHVCNYCLAHPNHIATVQQIEFLKREHLIKEASYYRHLGYDYEEKLQKFAEWGKEIKRLNDLLYKAREQVGTFKERLKMKPKKKPKY